MLKHRLNQFKHENVGMFDLASIGITLVTRDSYRLFRR